MKKNNQERGRTLDRQRRRFLAAIGLAASTGLAGCGGDDGSDETPTTTQSGTTTVGTDSPAPTATDSPTPTATPTATPTPPSWDVEEPTNWATFAGDGDFVPSKQGYDMIEEITDARQDWKNPTHTGIMKTSAGSAKQAQAAGFDPTYGELANPVAADGVVFVSWNQPTGDVRMPFSDFENRYWNGAGDQEGLAESFTKIDANWRTIAIDADTGETLWEATEQSASVHFSPGKRGHHGINGAYGNDVYVTISILGDVFAYDIDSGDRLWHHELPFKETAQGHKDTWLENKRLPNTQGDNPFSAKRYGSAVVGDVAAVPDLEGGMVGLSLEDGSQQWSVENALKGYATPQIWNDGDADWLLCNGPGEGGSQIKLINPASGEVAWTHQSGVNTGQLILGDSHVLLNVQAGARLACYELSTDGLTEAWRFEGTDDTVHDTDGDAGNCLRGAIRNGILYVALGAGSDSRKMRSVDIETGEELDRDSTPIPSFAHQPIPAEDKMFMQTDVGHDGNGLLIWNIDEEGTIERQGQFNFAYTGIDPRYGYETPLTLPYYDGRVYLRGTGGIYGIDLRKPLGGVTNLRFDGLWKGSSKPVKGKFISEGLGSVDTARVIVPRQEQLGVIFTTARRKNAWGPIDLESDLTIGESGERSSTFSWHTFASEVDLSFEDGDSWGGTWTWTVPRLDETHAFSGSIGSTWSETGFDDRVWLTPWFDDPYTKVGDLPDGQERMLLQLPAVLPTVRHPNPLDQRQGMLVCLDHDGETIFGSVGGAFSYNQAWHEVDPSGLELTDEGLSGTMTIILHPDPWENPNPAVSGFSRGQIPNDSVNGSMAGEITVDASFGSENDEGRRPVSGTWEATWGMALEKTGDIRVVEDSDAE